MIFQALSGNNPSKNVYSLCVLFLYFVIEKNQVEHVFGYCRETETNRDSHVLFLLFLLRNVTDSNLHKLILWYFKDSFSLL